MATRKSSKLSLEYRGAKIQFGIHKTTGQYRKTYRGKPLYLGDDPVGVLDQWIEKTKLVDDELDRAIEVDSNTLTVKDLCNLFLFDRQAKVQNQELSPATYQNYHGYCKLLIRSFGSKALSALAANDLRQITQEAVYTATRQTQRQDRQEGFKGTTITRSVKTKIRHVRVIFRFAFDEGYMDSIPMDQEHVWTAGTKGHNQATRQGSTKASHNRRDPNTARTL